MNHFVGLFDDDADGDAPPAKRLKLQLGKTDNKDLNNNIESEVHEIGLPSPKSDARKRKIALRRQVKKTIQDLSPCIVLEILDHLPLNGKHLFIV